MNLIKLLTKMTLRMINHRRFLLALLGSFCLSTTGIAQSWDIVTKVDAHQVVVRWVPLDPASWLEGQKKGFELTVVYQGTTKGSKKVTRIPQNSAYFRGLVDSLPKAGTLAELLDEAPTASAADLDFLYPLAMTLSSLHPRLADGLGMLWVDRPPKGVTHVTYRLSYPQGPVLVEKTVALREITTLFRPLDLTVEQTDSLFTFRWISGDSLLNWAYRLEMSEDGERWSPVDDLLILPAVDAQGNEYLAKEIRIPKFYVPYYFRVLAYTPFGEMSIPSRRVRVTGYRKRFPPVAVTYRPVPAGVQFDWNLADSLSAEIKGFRLYASRKIDQDWKEIALLPPEARTWTDTAARLDSYAKLALIDWGGGEHPSSTIFLTWEDSIPPPPVVKPVAVVSPEGLVRLQWPSRRTSDFLGYRVYRSDSPTANFVLITPNILSDTTWTDTLSLALLNAHQYYTIRAYDTRLNESRGNDTLVVRRPDVIPPAALAIRLVEQQEEAVYLQWFNSSSADVAWVQLLRQAPTDSLPCLLQLFDKDFPTAWADSTGEERIRYQYSLVAVDQSGLSSLPVSVTLQRLFTGVRPPLQGFRIQERTADNTVEISWETPKRPVRVYQIFRQGPSDTYLAPYRRIEGRYGLFEDQNIQAGQRYRYQVQAIFGDGSESMLGEPLVLEGGN